MRYLIILLFLTNHAFSQNYHYALDEASRESTPDTSAPTIPTNLDVTQITNSTATLSWVASTDDVGVVDYRIYNNGNLLLNSTEGPGNTYTLTGLTPMTSYGLTIRAVDAAGNESMDSNVINFTTTNDSTYTLTSTKRISIGVYDNNDRLLRTLVTNETKNAGTHTPPSWDGLDDDGQNVRNRGDHYLIVANDIEAEWEGIIGNTSRDLVGANKWKSQNFPKESLIIGDEIYFAWGSNEQSSTVQKASLSDYQRRIPLFYQPKIHPGFNNLAWDGTMLYMAGQSFWDTRGFARSYVSASTLENMFNHENWHTFSSGTTVSIYSSTFKVADFMEDTVNEPYITGLAVQTGNNNLFVFRESINSIHVIHKTTGALRQNIRSYINPKLGKIDSNGYLWFVHGNVSETLEKFTINNATGAITSTGVRLTGLVDVQALNITPDGKTVVVGDMATYDQFKAYDTSTLAYKWTLGRAESYSVDATVYNDKFMFRNHGDYNNNEPRYTSISFEKDGSIWVIDEGNERFIKFNSSRQYVDQVIWKSNFYSTNVDHSNPRRLFTGFLEYEIDYSKPLLPGNSNNAWKLVRNWGKVSHLKSLGVDYAHMQPLIGVETLSNGRTYGLAYSSSAKNAKLLEFVNGGVLRVAADIHVSNRTPNFKKGGILAIYESTPWALKESKITSFDANHNPRISGSQIWTTVINPANHGFMYQPMALSPPDKTANDILILFDKRKGDAGYYHLAGYRQGDEYPVFKTTKSVAYKAGSPYPLGTNTFDVRNSVKNAGSLVLAMDDWFIWGYYGEFWENTQTNYWHMLTEEGLFLHDFGTDNKNPISSGYSKAKMAGNAFGPSLVKVDGQVYLYHNDESFHGGVHRWKIKNLASIEKFRLKL